MYRGTGSVETFWVVCVDISVISSSVFPTVVSTQKGKRVHD